MTSEAQNCLIPGAVEGERSRGFRLSHLSGVAWRLPAWHRTKMLKARKGEDFPKPMMLLCKGRMTLPLHQDQAPPGAHRPKFQSGLCHDCLENSGRLPHLPTARLGSFARWAALNLKIYITLNRMVQQKQVSWGEGGGFRFCPVESQEEATHMHINPHLLPYAETKREPTLAVDCACLHRD